MPDRVGEVVGQRRVVQHYDGVMRPRRSRHLARPRGLVVFAALEPHREGRDRLVGARRGHAQHRRGVQAAAQQATHRHARDHAQADSLFRELSDAFDGVREVGDGGCPGGVLEPRTIARRTAPAPRPEPRPPATPQPPPSSSPAARGPRRRRQIPVALQPHPALAGPQDVPGRDLRDPGEERPPLVRAGVQRMVDRARIPRPRDPRREQGLRLRGQVQRAAVFGEEERLESEAVARGEELPGLFVPDDEGELTAQLLQAPGAQVFIEVQRDLAIGTRAETVPSLFQLRANSGEVVELAVDDDPQPPVLTCDRLKTLRVVDREKRMAETCPARRGKPGALAVRAPVPERRGRAPQRRLGDRAVAGQDCDDSAHGRKGPSGGSA